MRTKILANKSKCYTQQLTLFSFYFKLENCDCFTFFWITKLKITTSFSIWNSISLPFFHQIYTRLVYNGQSMKVYLNQPVNVEVRTRTVQSFYMNVTRIRCKIACDNITLTHIFFSLYIGFSSVCNRATFVMRMETKTLTSTRTLIHSLSRSVADSQRNTHQYSRIALCLRCCVYFSIALPSTEPKPILLHFVSFDFGVECNGCM